MSEGTAEDREYYLRCPSCGGHGPSVYCEECGGVGFVPAGLTRAMLLRLLNRMQEVTARARSIYNLAEEGKARRLDPWANGTDADPGHK